VPPPATYREVFAVREFRALWSSVILSTAGDRLALVALTLLVFDRTGSALLTAAVYAVGYLPWVVGGLFLAELADRYPRRAVMVVCDASRAVLVAAMVVPHLPIGVLVALLFVATLFAPPFDSAKASVTPDILSGERYVLGTAVLQTTMLTGEVLGAVGGGVAVAFIGVRSSLAIDAATFVLSGLIIGLGTQARPAAAQQHSAPPVMSRMRDGFRLVFGDRALSTLLLFGWLIVFYTVPAGIAAPYAASLGGGPIATGLIIAATALGTMLALPLFTRAVRPRQRINAMGPLAVLTCGTLVIIAARPGLVVSLAVFVASAAFGVYQVAANTAFVVRVPAPRRAQAFGIANMGVVVGQGAAYVAAGAVADVVDPATVIAVSGGLGAIVAVVLTLRWRHVSPPGGRHAVGRRPGNATASGSSSRPGVAHFAVLPRSGD
jgi:predicted MFS family arabinose efflux permease